MTDGRFETTIDLRPNGWDTRHHWTKTHKPFRGDPEHVRDHMERESCPFHDLRADGCFQPEYAGIGVDTKVTQPDFLVRRPGGNGMRTGAGVARGRGQGVGGLPIALDTEPPHPPSLKPAPGGHAPWKSGGKAVPGGFGGFPHMSEPEPEPIRGEAPKFFHTSRAPVIGAPVKHHPEPYQDPKPYGRKPFRLAAGVARRKDVIGPAPPCPPPEKPAKRSVTAPRAPLQAAKSVQGTFSQYPRYIPDPLDVPKIRTGKWALFTYWAKTKREMPIEVPFRAGPQSAEMVRPPPQATEALASTTANVTMRGRPRVGEMTLLRIK